MDLVTNDLIAILANGCDLDVSLLAALTKHTAEQRPRRNTYIFDVVQLICVLSTTAGSSFAVYTREIIVVQFDTAHTTSITATSCYASTAYTTSSPVHS